MRFQSVASSLCLAAMLAGCGGGGDSGSVVTATAIQPGTPAPSPAPTATNGCTLRERQDWVAAQLREWYLYPETLPTTLDPGGYTSVPTYLDALTATARAQGRDRFFTYLTSIAEENAFYASGASAGFGVRLVTTSTNRLYVTEAFENAPALAAGIDRGSEITAIGTTEANLRTVSAIVAAEGTNGVTTALGPNTPGTARVLRVTAPDGAARVVSVTKADYDITPVSSRYGAKILTDGGRRVGYVNLRTFISTADPALRQAFASFRAQGVTDVILDVRYNGGGLVSIAQLLGDLMGANRTPSDVFDYLTFRPEKAVENETRFFRNAAESIAPTKLAVIGFGGTASASELVPAAMLPYLRGNLALVGGNTFGKPVGQIALDRATCDDRLRVVAFATENAERKSGYFNGLAPFVERTCQASDDVTRPLGDAQESSVRTALDFIAGRSCTPITGAAANAQASLQAVPANRMTLLSPDRPTTPQREVPGLY